MRRLIAACTLAAGALVVVAQAPSVQVSAHETTLSETQDGAARGAASRRSPEAPAKIDPSKEADIRQLMDVTERRISVSRLWMPGSRSFAQCRRSQPDNPRAKQFADAFALRFQKHFDPRSLTETVIPIYDKHLSSEDFKELLAYYQSPFGQRMLEVLPEVAHESQQAGFKLGQQAAREAMEELKPEYPDFVPTGSDEEKHPGTDR